MKDKSELESQLIKIETKKITLVLQPAVSRQEGVPEYVAVVGNYGYLAIDGDPRKREGRWKVCEPMADVSCAPSVYFLLGADGIQFPGAEARAAQKE